MLDFEEETESLSKKSRRSRDFDNFFTALINEELSVSWDDHI
jgi:hypothetical protein